MCVCSLGYPARNTFAPYYIVICGLTGTIAKYSYFKNILQDNSIIVLTLVSDRQ